MVTLPFMIFNVCPICKVGAQYKIGQEFDIQYRQLHMNRISYFIQNSNQFFVN